MVISLRAVWTWVPSNPHTLKIYYEPDVASPDVQRILADGLRYTGPAAKQAEAVANVLGGLLEIPQPIDLGSREVEGTYTRIRLLRRSLEPISP